MSRGAFRLTPAARHDLSSIWEYTEEQWGVVQAESYLGDLRDAIERIATAPQRGRPCDEVREGYRRYAVGSHVLFYRAQTDGVDVIRILHQRMDVDRNL